jgi:hypothetical protein
MVISFVILSNWSFHSNNFNLFDVTIFSVRDNQVSDYIIS